MVRAARAKNKKGRDAPADGERLPPDVLIIVLRSLKQSARVRASEVCRSWRTATLEPTLWQHLKFGLQCDDEEGNSEAFLQWLLVGPRCSAVESLHIDIQDAVEAPTAGFVAAVMSNLTAALMLVRGTLRALTLETSGCLVVGQWAATLRCLRTACFVAGQLHVKQGLGQLPCLADLEFGSNAVELDLEQHCLPPSVTHLSLEHCTLSCVPPGVARLTRLRSLDLSQNIFVDEEGDEMRPLAALTGLECLKLANCHMLGVPDELSVLKRLRILHLGGNFDGLLEDEAENLRLDAALRPLRNLQVLVLSQCNIDLPEAVRRMGKLERLFVTSTPMLQLPTGAMCKSLRHICMDWELGFDAISTLEECTRLEMVTLARPQRASGADQQHEMIARELAKVLLRHPTVKQLNIVAAQGRGLHLSVHTLRMLMALQAAPRPFTLEIVDSWDSELVRIPNLTEFIESD